MVRQACLVLACEPRIQALLYLVEQQLAAARAGPEEGQQQSDQLPQFQLDLHSLFPLFQ